VVKRALVEAGARLLHRHRAGDGRDRNHGGRRADERQAPALAERREREAEEQREQCRAAEGEAQRAQHGPAHGGAQPRLGRADRRALAARGAQDDVALHGPWLEVQAHRRSERVEPHAPVGERHVGLDLSVRRRGDQHRDAPELGVVLAGGRDPQAEDHARQRERDDHDGREDPGGDAAATAAAPGGRSGVHAPSG